MGKTYCGNISVTTGIKQYYIIYHHVKLLIIPSSPPPPPLTTPCYYYLKLWVSVFAFILYKWIIANLVETCLFSKMLTEKERGLTLRNLERF